MDDESPETSFSEPEAGPTWAERAQLEPLEAVLDSADDRGGKNRLIDRVHKQTLDLAAGDVRASTVLDFGCGTGRLSDWLVRRGASVDGVDVTPEMMAVARGDGLIMRELARVLSGGGRFVAIERVTEADLGRGGTVGAYERMLAAANLRLLDVSRIRLSDSRILTLAQRFPVFAGLPITPWLVRQEAARRASAPLTSGRYADAVFRATKAGG